MIKINRTERPDKLKGVRKPETSNAWHHHSVRKCLHEMQFGKCCYCEADGLPVKGSGAAVEHFWPKNPHTEKLNDWDNLLLICAQCNGNKSNDFPLNQDGSPILINPSNDQGDPENHLGYIIDHDDPRYGEVFGTTNSGKETVKIIQLFDLYYTKERNNKAVEVSISVIQLKKARRDIQNNLPNAQADFDAARASLRRLIENASPYAGIARFIIRSQNLGGVLV